jgi:dipeptidase
LVAASQTTNSWIAQLRPGDVRHWATGSAAPCTGLFKPLSVQRPLDLGPSPTDRADEDSLWWRHERLHRWVTRNPREMMPRFTRERDAVEQAWFDDPPESAWAFAEGDRLLAKWSEDALAQQVADTRPGFVRRYWNRRNAEAGLTFDARVPAAI